MRMNHESNHVWHDIYRSLKTIESCLKILLQKEGSNSVYCYPETNALEDKNIVTYVYDQCSYNGFDSLVLLK